MADLTKKEKDLLALANAGGNDATLLLLEKISDLGDELDKIRGEIKKEPSDESKIESIAMRLAIKIVDIQKGEDGHTPTGEELMEIMKPLIPKAKDGHTPTNKELLAIIKPLIPKIKDGATPTKKELVNLITPLIPEVKNGKDGSPDTSGQIRDKLETLTGNDRLDVSAIRGIKKIVNKISSKAPLTIFGPGKTRIWRIDLSSQLDGVTKTFFLGTHYGIISVNSSSAPYGSFRETTDYNESGKNIVFTSNVEAGISLASGQNLIIKVLK